MDILTLLKLMTLTFLVGLGEDVLIVIRVVLSGMVSSVWVLYLLLVIVRISGGMISARFSLKMPPLLARRSKRRRQIRRKIAENPTKILRDFRIIACVLIS